MCKSHRGTGLFLSSVTLAFMSSSQPTTASGSSSLQPLPAQWFALPYLFGFIPASELYLVFVSSNFHSSGRNRFELPSSLSAHLQPFPVVLYQPVQPTCAIQSFVPLMKVLHRAGPTLTHSTTIFLASCSLNKAFSVGFTPALYQFHLADFPASRTSHFG